MKKGFTLIELLVVIAIIGLLASIVLVSMSGMQGKAKITKTLEFSQSLQRNLGAYAVGVWSFDEGSGTTALDGSGYDGNNGTITGAAYSLDTSHSLAGIGAGKYSLSFNGTTGNYVIKNPFNNFPSEEITVEFWMKSSDTTKAGTPFSYGGNNEFLIYDYRNFGIYIGGPAVGTGVSANDGSWHHIAVSWKSSDGSVKVYKDGNPKYSGTLRQDYSIVNSKSLVFGQEQDSEGGGFDTGQAFLGYLDEVRIYEKALTLGQIQKLYADGLGHHQNLAVK